MAYSLAETSHDVQARPISRGRCAAADSFRCSRKHSDDDAARERGDGEAAGFVPALAGTEEAGALRATTRQTGLVYYGRYYAPELGRFLNRDPIEEDGGLNLYGFCLNDPVNRHDFLGMDPSRNDTIESRRQAEDAARTEAALNDKSKAPDNAANADAEKARRDAERAAAQAAARAATQAQRQEAISQYGIAGATFHSGTNNKKVATAGAQASDRAGDKAYAAAYNGSLLASAVDRARERVDGEYQMKGAGEGGKEDRSDYGSSSFKTAPNDPYACLRCHPEQVPQDLGGELAKLAPDRITGGLSLGVKLKTIKSKVVTVDVGASADFSKTIAFDNYYDSETKAEVSAALKLNVGPVEWGGGAYANATETPFTEMKFDAGGSFSLVPTVNAGEMSAGGGSIEATLLLIKLGLVWDPEE